MAVFNKPADLPVEQVRALRARGLDNNQIVQSLQRGGYSSAQIFDSLNQADLVSAGPIGQSQPSFYGQQPQASQPAAQDEPAADEAGDEQVEEMIETIVEEKWQAVAGDIAKMNEWRADVDTKLIKMDQRITELKDNFDKLHQAIIGKIGEYDKNILSVGAEIKAMEKVFSKVLPVFTDNVNELNRITQTLGKK